MQNQLTSFLKGVDKAACQWFGEYGGALDAIGFALAVTPEPLSTKVGVGLMLANAAAEKGCNYDPNKTGAPIGEGDVGVIYCYKVSDIGNWIRGYDAQGNWKVDVSSNTRYVEITRVWRPTPEEIQFEALDGYGEVGGGRFVYQTELYLGFSTDWGVCLEYRDPEDPEPIKPPTLPPVTYTDPDNGCEMNITFKGYAEGPGGSVYQIQQIEPGNSARTNEGSTKANGGIISGCFFNPTIVVNKVGGGGGDEPPFTIPVPSPDPSDDGDEYWWKPWVQAALGGIVAGATEEILENLLNQAYPEMLYRAVSVCEKDASGEPISEAVEIPIPALKAPDAQIARLDAIVELLQAHKNFKQPICGHEKPELLGQWVTTRWESDEKMVDSGRRLRKLFRYRTQSTRDLGQLSAYWRDFTWQSGPVCVRHKGAWWGDPQVWAQSEAEGRRVIRHAAAEAGLDPDQVGGWAVSSSRSPRYGMSGTMKIMQKEGFPWVASRQGPNWPNFLAKTSDP